MPEVTSVSQTPRTWEEGVRAWLAACRAQGKSPATVEAYRSLLNSDRLGRVRGARPWELSLTREVMVDYLLCAQEDKLKRATIRAHAGRLRAFARWAVDTGLTSEEAATMLLVRRPRADDTLPTVLSDAELQRLLRAATGRDRMLVRFLVGTGLRLSECANVLVDDLVETPNGWLVRVRLGKGRKDRMVPLGLPGDPLGPELDEFVGFDRAPAPERERHLWLSDYSPHPPLGSDGIWRVIHRLSAQTGIHVHPHALRHTWATRAIAAGVPTEIVRRAGGWASLAVMQRYLHVSDTEMLRAWQADGHDGSSRVGVGKVLAGPTTGLARALGPG